MATWSVSSGRASRVSENDDRELKSLCLVHRHDPHALDAFFNNRGLVGFAPLGVSLEFLDEGAE